MLAKKIGSKNIIGSRKEELRKTTRIKNTCQENKIKKKAPKRRNVVRNLNKR